MGRLARRRRDLNVMLQWNNGNLGEFSGHLRDLVKELDIQMHLDGQGIRDYSGEYLKVPSLLYDPGVVLSRSAAARRASVFTVTSKMRCASYSLAVGPRELGGTCIHSSGGGGLVKVPDLFICYGCYASDGNYNYPAMHLTQMVRAEWTRRTVKDGTFADQ